MGAPAQGKLAGCCPPPARPACWLAALGSHPGCLVFPLEQEAARQQLEVQAAQQKQQQEQQQQGQPRSLA